MEVALDGAHGAAQGLCQGLHLGPAEARLVVGVIGEGAVGGDRLGGGSSEDEGLDFRDTGKSGLLSHRRLLFLVRRCALMIEFIKAAGPGQRTLRRFFYALFTGTYFTYPAILALAPIRTPGSLWGLRLSSFGLCKHLFTGWVEQIRHLVGRDR